MTVHEILMSQDIEREKEIAAGRRAAASYPVPPADLITALRGEQEGWVSEVVEAFGAVDWDAESLKTSVERLGAARGLKLGKAQAPVRVAVTGRTVGLPLFESLEVLGRDRTVQRLRAAIARLA